MRGVALTFLRRRSSYRFANKRRLPPSGSVLVRGIELTQALRVCKLSAVPLVKGTTLYPLPEMTARKSTGGKAPRCIHCQSSRVRYLYGETEGNKAIPRKYLVCVCVCVCVRACAVMAIPRFRVIHFRQRKHFWHLQAS